MIRINLLPVKAAKKRELGITQLVMGLMVIVVAAGANWMWQKREADILDEISREVRRTQEDIRELEKIIGEVKDIEQRKEQVEAKLDVLTDLRDRSTGPVKMMDELASLIPNEVWISRFNEAGMDLSLDGEALAHEDLAAFISALNRSPYFENIELRSARLQGSGDEKTVRFSITGRVVYST